ncbi:MAG: class F sortase [Acidimicrobiales bacterium]
MTGVARLRGPSVARWLWAVSLALGTVALAAVLLSWRPAGPSAVGTVPISEVGRAKAMPDQPILRLAPVARAGPIATFPARADRLPALQPTPPVSVRIDALGVDAPIVAVGVEPGTGGVMSVPSDGGLIGWYEHGPSPGETGSAVLAGHVDFDGRPGAFFELRRIEPGAVLVVRGADGIERSFVVQGRQEIAKADLPVSRLFTRSGPSALVLVTCGGSFDRSAGSYTANVVVYAVPA